ncbi:class I SAM-dependent methyltransferase [Streptomyces sp. TRM70308]|uniref:class I SAM-dependent methyltransferase n=1 Tax=Streptomyces sp. TRM70308 TaxID=3131932 RepID=UPI003D065C2E
MTPHQREGHRGSGPGAITPDGCAVELYARMPAGDEPEIVAGAVPAGATLLELGSGAGRVTHPLLERGFRVTAVDESPQMLARVRGARTVCGAIEDLELDERFDAVLLASFLVHTADAAGRAALLAACRRHVADDGRVLVQREGYDWHSDLPRERPVAGGGTVRIVSCEPAGGVGAHSVHAEYVFPDARWTHTFRTHPLTREAFESALTGADLRLERYLTDDHVWALARPA